MYHSGVTQSSPNLLPGGSEIGTTQNSRVLQFSGTPAVWLCVQPATSMVGTATRPNSHIGDNRLMLRSFNTRQGLPGERSSELAMTDPARANMMPIAGNMIGSHLPPNTWYVITKINARDSRESM